MPYRTYTSDQIADFILTLSSPDEGDLISNLKLQKLCYYALAIATAARPEGAPPLFAEHPQAWLHGPVIPSVYRRFKKYSDGAIPIEEIKIDDAVYDERDTLLLQRVYEHYGQFSAWKLRQMTHQESPWKDYYEEGQNNIIPSNAMRSFFADKLKDDFVEQYRKYA